MDRFLELPYIESIKDSLDNKKSYAPWVQDIKRRALKDLEKEDILSQKNENWRFSSLEKILTPNKVSSFKNKELDLAIKENTLENFDLLVFIDGIFSLEKSTSKLESATYTHQNANENKIKEEDIKPFSLSQKKYSWDKKIQLIAHALFKEALLIKATTQKNKRPIQILHITTKSSGRSFRAFYLRSQ